MRFVSFVLVAGLVAAIAPGLRLHAPAAAAAPVLQQNPAVERFVLQSSGDVPDCAVEKAEGQGPLFHVLLAPDCEAILPGLSTMHYWIEQPDGTVELSADGMTAAVVFAPADGIAYESIEPRTPLLSLVDDQ